MLYPAELLRQVTVAIIPVFRPDCKCPLQFCARFLILQDGHEPLHGLRLRGNWAFWKQQKKRVTKTDRQRIAFLPYCVCRGDHWSPVYLPQQRIFRDSFLQGKRARASNARPYKSFSTAWKNPTARKQLDISIKRTLKIGHRLCRFCAIHQRKKEAVAQGKNPSAAASLRLNASRSTKTLAIDPLISKKQITQTGPSE